MPYKNKEDAIAYAKKYRKENSKKRKEQAKQYYNDNHEKIKKYHAQYREENRKEILRKQRQYVKEHREERNEYSRKWHLKDKFNLSYEDWLVMWESQNERCAICGEPFISPSNACIDHNHKTNEIRGLLCRKCNAAIGLLNNDSELLKKAIKYLKKYN